MKACPTCKLQPAPFTKIDHACVVISTALGRVALAGPLNLAQRESFAFASATLEQMRQLFAAEAARQAATIKDQVGSSSDLPQRVEGKDGKSYSATRSAIRSTQVAKR